VELLGRLGKMAARSDARGRDHQDTQGFNKVLGLRTKVGKTNTFFNFFFAT